MLKVSIDGKTITAHGAPGTICGLICPWANYYDAKLKRKLPENFINMKSVTMRFIFKDAMTARGALFDMRLPDKVVA